MKEEQQRHEEDTELTERQRRELEEIKKDIEELARGKRFNPLILEELENKTRAVLQPHLSSSLSFVTKLNHFLDLLKDARDDSSTWHYAVERAMVQLTELLKSLEK